MIAALFVDPAGPYIGQPAVDPWDKARDARLYAGPLPVVAHPPCERWGRFAKGSPRAQVFEIGDDGGCFQAALDAVRTFGGVLEHPEASHAFGWHGLPIPSAGKRKSAGWTPKDPWGGRSCHVDQGAYGHPAQKATWLYAVLPVFPELSWGRTWGRATIRPDKYSDAKARARAKAAGRYVKGNTIPKSERHLTPPAFRDVLVGMAESCSGWQPTRAQVQLAPFAIEGGAP